MPTPPATVTVQNTPAATVTVQSSGQVVTVPVDNISVVTKNPVTTNVVAVGQVGPSGATGPAGPTGPQGPAGTDLAYTHNQGSAASTWTITHNLGKMPSVSVVDSADNWVIGEVLYTSINALSITFSSAFSGKAYLN